MEEEKQQMTTTKSDSTGKYKWAIAVLVLIIVAMGSYMLGAKNNSAGAAVVDNTNQQQQQQVAADVSIFLDSPNEFPSLGPENAKTVVIEFSDFQCPYCALASGLPEWATSYQAQYGDLVDAAGKIQEMAANGKLRFIYVPMSFLGQESVYAAQASLCANEQGKFWEMHDAIFGASDGPSENTGKYSKENLKVLAQGISGLDQTKFASCLDSDETLATVKDAASKASTAASGTPTFYVNGKQVSASWTALSAAIGA